MPPRKRTVAPGSIKNLGDWLSYWPSAGNVGFDPVTREPAIYSNDSERKKLMSIPWRREVDTITVLTQPNDYTPQIVGMAQKRFESIQEQQAEIIAALEEQQQAAEELVLEEWNAYREAPPAMRAIKMSDIVAAEKALAETEKALAEQRNLGSIYDDDNESDLIIQYTPPMPLGRRGIPFGDTTIVATAAPPVLSTSSADSLSEENTPETTPQLEGSSDNSDTESNTTNSNEEDTM